MKKIVDAHATYRPADENIEKELRESNIEAYRQAKLIQQNQIK